MLICNVIKTTSTVQWSSHLLLCLWGKEGKVIQLQA